MLVPCQAADAVGRSAIGGLCKPNRQRWLRGGRRLASRPPAAFWRSWFKGASSMDTDSQPNELEMQDVDISSHQHGQQPGQQGEAGSSSSAGRRTPAQPAASAPAGTHMEAVREVYEWQRWYGVTWESPLAVLDQPGWTDTAGKAVALPKLPPADLQAWEVTVTGATDSEGWCYGTVFRHLGHKRPGGRASQRLGDLVRRRLWRLRASQPAAAAVVVDGDGGREAAEAAAGATAPSAVAQAALAEVDRAAVEAEAKRKALKHFVGLLLDLLARRSLFQLVPWDPTGLPQMYYNHQQVLKELQLSAAQRPLFGEDAPPPPSPLPRPGRMSHNLLQDMLCAAQHAQAAYGFAMQQGYFSSIRSYVYLQTLQPLKFDAIGGVSNEANNEAVAALAGLDTSDIIMAEWRNMPCRPCHYVAIDRANEVIVLSIRGSLQVGDLLSDLSASPFFFEYGRVQGHVHPGMLSSATYVHCNTQAALAEAAQRCPGWPLLITGHSLGGGVAALLAVLLQTSGLPPGMGPVAAITYGTPAVMSEELAAACEDFVTSVVLGADIIPHLSVASVETLLLEANAASPVQRTVREFGRKLGDALGVTGNGASPGQPVREASMRLARAASAKGLAAVMSLLSSAAVDQAEAASAQAEGSSAPSISMIDLSQGEPFSLDGQQPSRAAASALEQEQQQHAAPRQVPVLWEETPEPEQPQQQQGLAARQSMHQLQRGNAASDKHIAGSSVASQVDTSMTRGSIGRPEAVSELVSGIEAAGLEGFFDPGPADLRPWQREQQAEALRSHPLAGTADDTGAAAWGQDREQREEATGSTLPPVDVDTPALAAAIAQNTGKAAAGGKNGAPAGGDAPELLLPPGRLIWLFKSAPKAEPSSSTAGSGNGEVDVQEACERVERQGGASVDASTDAQGDEQQAVAALAERHTFSKILLHPDMLDDHVPDAYLAALRAL